MKSDLRLVFTQAPVRIRKGTAVIEEVSDLVMRNGRAVVPHNPLATKSVDTCTAIALLSNLKNKLFHVDPNAETAKNVKKKLTEEIEDLQSNPKNRNSIRAIIIGGVDPVVGNEESLKSQALYDAAAEVAFDEYKLPGIFLCGKKLGVSKEDVLVRENKATVHISDFKPKQNDEKSIRECLADRYAYIEEYGDVVSLDFMA